MDTYHKYGQTLWLFVFQQRNTFAKPLQIFKAVAELKLRNKNRAKYS